MIGDTPKLARARRSAPAQRLILALIFVVSSLGVVFATSVTARASTAKLARYVVGMSATAMPIEYVAESIGTTGGGNTSPDAAAPFGMIEWGPAALGRPPGGLFSEPTHRWLKPYESSRYRVRGTGGYSDPAHIWRSTIASRVRSRTRRERELSAWHLDWSDWYSGSCHETRGDDAYGNRQFHVSGRPAVARAVQDRGFFGCQ